MWTAWPKRHTENIVPHSRGHVLFKHKESFTDTDIHCTVPVSPNLKGLKFNGIIMKVYVTIIYILYIYIIYIYKIIRETWNAWLFGDKKFG